VEKEALLRGDIDCRPSLALRHPCCPIYPRHPYLPKGAKEPGTDASTSVSVNLTTQRPIRAPEAARLRCATRLETRGWFFEGRPACRWRVFVTTEGDPISERPRGALTDSGDSSRVLCFSGMVCRQLGVRFPWQPRASSGCSHLDFASRAVSSIFSLA
jgi:hypothetical protein